MPSFAIGLLGFGLVISCLAGFRVLLFGVDLLTGQRDWSRPKPADLVLIGLALLGILCLAAGLLLLHSARPGVA